MGIPKWGGKDAAMLIAGGSSLSAPRFVALELFSNLVDHIQWLCVDRDSWGPVEARLRFPVDDLLAVVDVCTCAPGKSQLEPTFCN